MIDEDDDDPAWRCPKCGGSMSFGFGLAGGGYGGYKMCLSDECDYFEKPIKKEPTEEDKGRELGRLSRG